MSYTRYDLRSPVQSEYLLNRRAQNELIDSWPKELVGGVWCFAKLNMAHDEEAITVSSDTEDGRGKKRVMAMLGINYDDMHAHDWTGVQDAWYHFVRTEDVDRTAISVQQLYREIGRNQLEDRFAQHDTVFQIHSVGRKFTDAEVATIHDDFRNGTNLGHYQNMSADVEDDQTWFIAYADTAGLVYDKTVDIHPQVGKMDNGSVNYTITITMKYGIKEKDADGNDYLFPDITECGSHNSGMFSRVYANDVWPKYFRDMIYGISSYDRAKRLEGMTDAEKSADDKLFEQRNAFFLLKRTLSARAMMNGAGAPNVDGRDANGYYPEDYTYEGRLRVDRVEVAKLKAFAKVIKKSLKFDYDKKKGPWWVKVVAVIIVIIIIAIALFLAPFTGGGSILAGASVIEGIAIVATWVAIVASVTALALSLYAGWVADQGWAADAEVIGRMAMTAGKIAKYAGYIAMAAGGYQMISNGFEKPALDELGNKIIEDGVPKMVQMGTGEIASQIIGWVNTIGNIVIETLNDNDKKDEEDLENRLSAQEDELADFATPKLMNLIQETFDSGMIYENSTTTNSSYYTMTQGRVDLATTKYY